MRDWSLLKRRLSDLRLRPYLRSVANLLIEGRTTREIATMLGCTQQEVKLRVAAILYHLSRLPPDPSDAAEIPVRPSPAPPKPGHTLRP
jgi:DNA-directed RNA polymerase specialized sigma24 family protein